jgi:Protein of unknown function (DUF2971)
VLEAGKCVYHYTKGSIAIEHILPSLTLKMGTFQFLNDPREAKSWPFKFYSRSSESNGHFPYSLFDEASKYITQRTLVLCCSIDDPSVTAEQEDRYLRSGLGHSRMWTQYADNHRGVCFMINQQRLHESIVSHLGADSLFYGPVEYLSTTYGPNSVESIGAYDLVYWEDILDRGLVNVLEPHIKQFHKELFFTKHIDWRDEREYRWVYRSNNNEPIYVPIANCLDAVLLGSDCPKDTSRIIIDLCRPHNIPVCRVHWHGWAVSVFQGLLDDDFDFKNIFSLNGLSFSTDIPCGGVFLQGCDQHGNVRPVLIENDGSVRIMN